MKSKKQSSKEPKSKPTKKKHPLLKWLIDDFGGILSLEPYSEGGEDYANGDTGEDRICFWNEQDAINQCLNIVSIMRQRIYENNPAYCSNCDMVIPYAVTQNDPEWTCPECKTPNMGK